MKGKRVNSQMPDVSADKKPQTPFTPIRYHGGKTTMLKHILPLVPEHRLYIEAFGGSGILLLNKEPSSMEIYNDLNGEVVNFFRQVRQNSKALMRLLRLVPYSREEYLAMRDSRPADDVERAMRFFVMANQAFNGYAAIRKSGWRTNRERNVARQFANKVDALPRLVERLRDVHIECLDFERLLSVYAIEDAFAYLDPPYIGVERNRYAIPFGDAEHERLARAAAEFPGKVMVSYFDHPKLREIYKGWKIKLIKRSGSGGNLRKVPRRTVTEMLIMNYDPQEPVKSVD